ncbi:FecR domain-containing protein [uncultured Duncaniella sp.]|uniref:FecR family protein n=1 Tax=uncultured Duncaniella sp. TaxID=2768039 RepID=UPI0025A9969C|nr:FecR domain-containing protein [uncultured Duncaniella sp.]
MEDPIIYSDRLFSRLTGNGDNATSSDKRPAKDTDHESEAFIDSMNDPEYIESQIREMERFDVDSAWRRVKQLSDAQNIPPDRKKRHSLRILRIWTSVAAMIAVVACLTIYLKQSSPDITPPMISEEISLAIEKCEKSGMSGAIIEKGSAVSTQKFAVSRKKETTGHHSEQKDVVADMLSATKVTTYYDKEFWLTLPDGSVVHLGSNTRIIYPERFDNDSRDVYLEGEAYFMVAKSDVSRFTVHTSTAATTVYGTEFNVSAPGDDRCEVVLVKGSVSVSTPTSGELMLKPGEGAEIADGTITVSEVDVTPYEAWNTGRIDFTDWTLEKLMSVIGKWYNMDIRFSDEEFSQIEITGSFNRYETLTPTIESLSVITGLTITADGNTIIVAP